MMMDLDQQIQVLIQDAPQDETADLVATIAPALKLLAGQLHHLQYYILQTLEQNWLLTTLSNSAQPGLEKHVIYAFPSSRDATRSPAAKDMQVIAVAIPVTHILFQMMAMDTVDSLVFFETVANLEKGTEILRQDLQTLVQEHLRQRFPPNISSNIA